MQIQLIPRGNSVPNVADDFDTGFVQANPVDPEGRRISAQLSVRLSVVVVPL